MAERDTSLVLDPAWDSAGLITGIVTDAASGELLMVAHLNDEALALTQSTGIAHFWSRSRSRIWKKGEESGNVMRVKELRIDCDQDALWIIAEPAGPACHTGKRSCFFRQIDGTALSAAVPRASESRLAGTWHLVSFEMRGGNGDVAHPLSEYPQGQIVYDDVGNMSCHLLNPDPPARPNDAADGADYEASISYTRYASYYGRYEVDAVARVVHHHVTGALMPGWAGTTVDRDYVFDGDDNLTLSARIEAIDQTAVLKWQRAR